MMQRSQTPKQSGRVYFYWKKHPEVVQCMLQFIEDHLEYTGRGEDWSALHGYLSTIIEPNISDTVPSEVALTLYLKRLVEQHSLGDTPHNIADLWSSGPRILDLKKLQFVITPNPARYSQVNPGLSYRHKNSFEISTDLKQYSTEYKQHEVHHSIKDRLTNVDDDEEESNDVEQRPKSRKRPTTSSSRNLAIRPSQYATEHISKRLRRTLSQSISFAQNAGEVYERKSDKFHSDISRRAPSISTLTPLSSGPSSADDQTEWRGISKGTGSDESQGNTEAAGCRVQIENSEEEAEAENIEHLYHDDRSKQGVPRQMAQKIVLKVDGKSLPKHGSLENPRRRLPVSSLEPSTEPDSGIYMPTGPRNLDAEDIQKTMEYLHRETQFAIDRELDKRHIAGSQPFRLDEKQFDDEGSQVLYSIFGFTDMDDLKCSLTQAQTQRRLQLSTFMVSFVVASITKNVLQKSLVKAGQNDSKIAAISEFLMHYGWQQQRDSSNHEDYLKNYKHQAYRFALHNYIERDVIPTMDAEASKLAKQIQYQLLSLIPAAPPKNFFSIPQRPLYFNTALLEMYRRKVKGTGQQGSGMNDKEYEASFLDFDRDPQIIEFEPDEFFRKLQKIIKTTMEVKARLEGQHNLAYEFVFPTYLSRFTYPFAHSEEPEIDLDQPNQVFVTLLPTVWAQQINAMGQYLPRFCASIGMAYLRHPILRDSNNPNPDTYQHLQM